MKHLLTLLLLLLFSAAHSQKDAVDELIYGAYLSQEPVPDQWRGIVAARKKELEKNPQDRQARFNLSLAQFALLSSTMRTKDEKLFDEYYEETVDGLKALVEDHKSWAEPQALLSAVYGLKMGFSPMQGMFLGAKSSSLVDKARKLDPQSPLAWKVYANSKYFTPEMWGGDLKESIESYEECIRLFESAPAGLAHNWLYLDALAFQGQAYLKNGDTGKAIEAYEKALRAEPAFTWVKYVLLPRAKEKKQG